MRYEIVESSSGDSLGMLETDAIDDSLIESLVRQGFLDPPADRYTLDYSYSFADGSPVIVDDDDEPVLTLEPEGEDSEEDDDDDADNSDEELNGDDSDPEDDDDT